MKLALRLASAAIALTLAAPALGQQPATHPRVGVGLSLNPSLLTDLASAPVFASPSKLYVPFYVAPNLRIEPEIGWLSVTNDTESTNNHSFDLGVGALYLKPVAASTSLYGGVRLASIWAQEEARVSPTIVRRTSQRNTALAAVFGTEYLPIAWFSVGVEGQLSITFLGDEEVSVTGAPTTTGSGGSVKAIQGLFFLRAYFL